MSGGLVTTNLDNEIVVLLPSLLVWNPGEATTNAIEKSGRSAVIIGEFYAGDDMDLAKRQHDFCNEALAIMVGTCNRYTRIASTILQDTEHEESGRVTSFDHRTIQDAHDLLAAAWRFKVSPPQTRVPFADGGADERDMTCWLEWLKAEVSSWIEEPRMIRLVQVILTNQNQAIGYEAETSLGSMILRRFSDVPWKDSLRTTLTGRA